MKKYRVRGEIVGMFVEVEEFATKREALAKKREWFGIFDDVLLYEVK